MNHFWEKYFTGTPFTYFGPSHLAAIAVVLLASAALFFWRNPSEQARRRFRYGVVAVLILNEVILHSWWISVGLWTPQEMLPFHLCAVMVYASAVLLVTMNRSLYQIVYFLGLIGVSQALISPNNAPYNFPHWRYFSIFIGHGAILMAIVYMTVIEGYRPTIRGARNSLIAINLYAIPVFALNFAIGSNFLFINSLPDIPGLARLLPPWPYYLPVAEVLLVVFMVIFYLPFAIKDWRARRAGATS